MKKKPYIFETDSRPRFGWAKALDDEPQVIYEKKRAGTSPVVVIPMPFGDQVAQARVRRLWKNYWWPSA